MMHPPRFSYPNFIPHQNQWRSIGPRFGPVRPMQYRNNQNGRNYPNNNEDHWCETCDRGFRTPELLNNHKQQHQKCNIDGCQFIAHPKVITKHIQMQHSTGLYKKIAKLDNPEEVQKWREERKKRYPTKENIEKRNAEIKEKIERGEKMGMRHNKDRFNGREQGMKRKFGQDNNRNNFKRKFQENQSFTNHHKNPVKGDTKKPNESNNHRKIVPSKKEKNIPQVDNSETLKPFTGISNLIDDINNDDIEDELKISDSIEEDEYIIMDEFVNKNNSENTEPVVCGALSSLMCNYESSDEETFDKNTQLQHSNSESLKITSTIAEEADAKPENKPEDNNINHHDELEKSDDDSGPEETKIVKATDISNMDVANTHSEDSSKLESFNRAEGQDKGQKNRSIHINNNQKKFKPKLPSTLLEKLLRNEIRQERNIVLQCIRYIIKNNYFEKR